MPTPDLMPTPNLSPDRRRPGRALALALVSPALAVLLFALWWCGDLAQRPSRLSAEEADGQPAKQWALLIGCERYHRASHLRYTINDVRQLSDTLQTRGGLPSAQVLAFTDDEPNPRFQPLRASLLAELPAFLRQPGPRDQIIVYFSGHGFLDRDGHMYLAPLDCDPANSAATGISIEWFRDQLAACRAQYKFLIIDSCHAGSEKGEGDDDPVVAAKDLGEPFRNLSDVITLASSTADEKSQLWDEKQQSLYSYWINQALKGHADRDGDNVIDIDELNRYVHDKVVETARRRFPRSQTPVRIIRTGQPGSPTVLRLRPLSLKEVLSDIAEELSWAVEDRKLGRVAILEFGNQTPLGTLLGADFGLLGSYCSSELEKRLVQSGVQTIDRQELERALRQHQFTLGDLESPEKLAQLSNSLGELPVLAVGLLRSRAGREVGLECKLLETATGRETASAAGLARISEHEWAMLGRSAAVADGPPPALATPPVLAASGEELVELERTSVVEQLDEAASGTHPLSDANFPYRLKLMVDGEERLGVFRGNDYFVPVKQGEKYVIEVENRDARLVLLKLLVDGLDTLPHHETLPSGQRRLLVAPRVNLEDANYWVLDARAGAARYWISGFTVDTGRQGAIQEFVVTAAENSLAARMEFSEQVGIITAAFYADDSGSRGVGTGAGTTKGDRVAQPIETRRAYRLGDLLAVVHLRYVDADAVQP